jgi:hypothetical protein
VQYTWRDIKNDSNARDMTLSVSLFPLRSCIDLITSAAIKNDLNAHDKTSVDLKNEYIFYSADIIVLTLNHFCDIMMCGSLLFKESTRNLLSL